MIRGTGTIEPGSTVLDRAARRWRPSCLSGMFAAGALSGCVPEEDPEARIGDGGRDLRPGLERVFPGDVWEEISPGEAGMNRRRLEEAVSWLEEQTEGGEGAEELVIVRGGRIVWAGEHVDRVHGIWSMTKAFSSTLFGILVREGACDLETPVHEVLPELAPHYPEVTFRHLFTMTSGYEAVGDWPPENPHYVNGGSRTPFDPSGEAQFPPGEAFSYWDSAYNLTGLAMVRLTGKSLDELFAEKIAGPIGMDSEAWRWPRLTVDGDIAIHAASGNKGKHLEISAREAARFGYLMLNEGRWKDRQLIGRDWVESATSPQVPAELPLGGPITHLYGKRFPFDGRGCYGLAWWTNGKTVGGSRLWPDLPERSFMAWGYNNNLIFVVPEWDLVVVRMGQDARTARRLRQPAFNEFLMRIGESIRD